MSFQLLYFIVYWIQHSLPFHPLRLSDFSMLSPLTLFDQPCLCLCLGFSQMILMLPFLLITLHFSQMGFTDDLTFMVNPPFTFVSAFLGAGIDILIPARKSTDKIIIRGNANCKQNFQKQFRHQKKNKTGCASLLAADCFILFEGGGRPRSRSRQSRRAAAWWRNCLNASRNQEDRMRKF